MANGDVIVLNRRDLLGPAETRRVNTMDGVVVFHKFDNGLYMHTLEGHPLPDGFILQSEETNGRISFDQYIADVTHEIRQRYRGVKQ